MKYLILFLSTFIISCGPGKIPWRNSYFIINYYDNNGNVIDVYESNLRHRPLFAGQCISFIDDEYTENHLCGNFTTVEFYCEVSPGKRLEKKQKYFMAACMKRGGYTESFCAERLYKYFSEVEDVQR